MVERCKKRKPASKVEVLAIIPARGGSKSIPQKNIKLLGGVPLIGYSIAAGKRARTVTRLIVSTDDEEIARIAESFDAEVPFMRPKELAQDETTDLPVFQHALRWLEKFEGYQPDIIVQLRPTSPLRPPDCVDRAVRALLKNPATDSVRTVVPSEQNPYKMWRIEAGGLMKPILKMQSSESYNQPRQRLPQTFWQTGHVDAARFDTIMCLHSMTGDTICPVMIDPTYAVDIDTKLDWERAEWTLASAALEIVKPVGFKPRLYPVKDIDAAADDHKGPDAYQFVRRDSSSVWSSEETKKMLSKVRLLVLDFDGVMTDNRVLVRQDGSEAVWCNRSDGMGLARLRAHGLEAIVLSTETNPCVTARTQKLGIDCVQGCSDKLGVLRQMARQRNLEPHEIAYIGNDINDLECLRWVGVPIVVADGEKEIIAAARFVTERKGGRGAVREVADLLVNQATPKRRADTDPAFNDNLGDMNKSLEAERPSRSKLTLSVTTA